MNHVKYKTVLNYNILVKINQQGIIIHYIKNVLDDKKDMSRSLVIIVQKVNNGDPESEIICAI